MKKYSDKIMSEIMNAAIVGLQNGINAVPTSNSGTYASPVAITNSWIQPKVFSIQFSTKVYCAPAVVAVLRLEGKAWPGHLGVSTHTAGAQTFVPFLNPDTCQVVVSGRVMVTAGGPKQFIAQGLVVIREESRSRARTMILQVIRGLVADVAAKATEGLFEEVD
ncbi:MAG TPA: hypothetical protein VM487_05320 [Phycisphaerae bacterium]|nr:hypothetical protein [Phycisphaerae bacterium]